MSMFVVGVIVTLFAILVMWAFVAECRWRAKMGKAAETVDSEMVGNHTLHEKFCRTPHHHP